MPLVNSRFCLSIFMMIHGVAHSLAQPLPLEFIDVNLTPEISQYCHVVRFPQGWKIQGLGVNGHPLVIGYYHSEYV